MLIVSKLTLF